MIDHIRSETADGILTLTLNRPEKKNALTRPMYQALADGLTAAEQNADLRCVLIQAEGDTFTAGNDLNDFAAVNADDPDGDDALLHGNPLAEKRAPDFTRVQR